VNSNATNGASEVLRITELSKNYGGLKALDGVSFACPEPSPQTAVKLKQRGGHFNFEPHAMQTLRVLVVCTRVLVWSIHLTYLKMFFSVVSYKSNGLDSYPSSITQACARKPLSYWNASVFTYRCSTNRWSGYPAASARRSQSADCFCRMYAWLSWTSQWPHSVSKRAAGCWNWLATCVTRVSASLSSATTLSMFFRLPIVLQY